MLPSPSEILVILVAVLILFGGKRMPELARNVGKWIRKLQNASREFQREINLNLNDDEDRQKPDLKG